MSRSCLVSLWEASGRPAPDWQGKARMPRAAPVPRCGVCALTGASGVVWPLGDVSDTLTAYVDRMAFRNLDPLGIALGEPAAWAFRHLKAMWFAHAAGPDGFVRVDGPELYAALLALADDPSCVVTVPVSMQRHLLPFVEAGHIATDRGNLRWAACETRLLAVYAQLRAVGFGEIALAEPVPRWPILSRLEAPQRREVLDLWGLLDMWRARPWYLDVAARATRTKKTKKEKETV